MILLALLKQIVHPQPVEGRISTLSRQTSSFDELRMDGYLSALRFGLVRGDWIGIACDGTCSFVQVESYLKSE
jgi:hypothetical protein